MRKRRFGLLELLRDDVDPKVAAVDRDRLADAVDDPAAPGRDDDQLHPVVFGQGLVAVVLRHREPAQAPDQQPADRHLGAADQQHPARECQRLVDRGEAAAVHCPSLQRSSRAMIEENKGKAAAEISSGGTAMNDRQHGPDPGRDLAAAAIR